LDLKNIEDINILKTYEHKRIRIICGVERHRLT